MLFYVCLSLFIMAACLRAQSCLHLFAACLSRIISIAISTCFRLFSQPGCGAERDVCDFLVGCLIGQLPWPTASPILAPRR